MHKPSPVELVLEDVWKVRERPSSVTAWASQRPPPDVGATHPGPPFPPNAGPYDGEESLNSFIQATGPAAQADEERRNRNRSRRRRAQNPFPQRAIREAEGRGLGIHLPSSNHQLRGPTVSSTAPVEYCPCPRNIHDRLLTEIAHRKPRWAPGGMMAGEWQGGRGPRV